MYQESQLEQKTKYISGCLKKIRDIKEVKQNLVNIVSNLQ